MAADDIALPFDNVCLAPLFYLVMKLDTTDEDPKNEDNRRLLADIVLFCVQILQPNHNPPEHNIAADDFDGYLLNLALSGLPFDGLRYGRSLFPDYPSDAMPVINAIGLLALLQNCFEDTGSTGHYAQLLLFTWGLLGEYKRQDILAGLDFKRYFDSAMRAVNGLAFASR